MTQSDTAPATPIENGCRVRTTRDVEDLRSSGLHSGGRHYPAGFEFEVEDARPGIQPDDPRYQEDGWIKVPFVYGNAFGGINNVCLPQDVLEVAMSAEAVASRTPPTVDEFARALGGALCGMDTDTFTTDETNQEGQGVVLVAGQTHEGLRFAAYVQVLRTEYADF